MKNLIMQNPGGAAEAIALNAAADFLGNGAIEVNLYEREILDVIRRTSVALQRMPQLPATGHPHRYFEQTAIGSAAAMDPRSISPTPTGPTRVERSAPIKAVVNQTNIGLFDREITEQQGLFAGVVAKDIEDVISSIEVKRAQMLWAGTDTSLTSPTTLEWMGALTQITQQATIAPGVSIIDGIKTQVATMVANTTFVVRPTAIYMNPILADYIDQEAKAMAITLKTMQVTAGVTVNAISTQAGDLPIIGEAFMPTDTGAKYGFSAPPAGNKNYYAVILMESMIEIPVVSGAQFTPRPRLYQLGLVSNLSGQYVGIKFDALICKGPSYAHSTVCVNRP